MAERQNSLQWYPTFAARELADLMGMPVEQVGAYHLLRLQAWGDATKEPRLPADDASLAFMSRLGARWAEFGGRIRALFIERDGWLYHAEWTQLWLVQQAKYKVAASKGKRGGNKKAINSRNSLAERAKNPGKRGRPRKPHPGELPQEQRVSDGKIVTVSSALAELQRVSSSALAIDVSLSEKQRAGATPDGGAPGSGPADQPPEQLELAIGAKVEQYRRAHPDEAAALESDVRAELRVSRTRILEKPEQLRVERRMAERITADDVAPRIASGSGPP